MFRFCPQCGWLAKTAEDRCPVCEHDLEVVPAQYLSAGGNLFVSQDARRRFILEVIESGKAYLPELAAKRDDILAEKKEARTQAVQSLVEEYQATRPTRRCPVCSSENLSRISNAGKVAKVALIGVWGAGDLGKQWRCNSCSHKF